MTVTVNGKDTELADNPSRTVDSMLEELNVTDRLYVTVELNGDILDRATHKSTPIRDGDVIEFLYFMGGGCAAC